MALHPQSLAALSAHFAQFPQTRRELQVAAEGSLDSAWDDEEDAASAGDAHHSSHKRRRNGPRGPPPLLMRPHASVSPEQAHARAADLAGRVAASPGVVSDPARARQPPVDEASKRSILDAVETNQVVLIAGATGCGKTTQVPQYLIDDAWAKGRGAAIMCTQPRRISAVTVSERVATERGEHIGQGTVGYQIRLENKAGPDTSLLFCTNGVLLRRLTSPGADAMLASLSHIVIDELHERDLFADFLTIVLRSAMARHPHLRLVLMSATVRESLFSDYFGGCPG